MGSASPATPVRAWYARTPTDTSSAQHSGASSPTTSLLLHMWGYDDTHAPPRRPGVGGFRDSDDAGGSPQWRRLVTDTSFVRRAAALVFGLAIVASLIAALFTTGSHLRLIEDAAEDPADNSTEPVLSLVEQHPPFPLRLPVDGSPDDGAGYADQKSTSGAGRPFPPHKITLAPGEGSLLDGASVSSVIYRRDSLPYRPESSITSNRNILFEARAPFRRQNIQYGFD
ncbi:hypothetical protein V5799_019439 [Amblyomma americanum]|uniref:Uncharacterized protein n=1 Tax=Amblyomma americanum TaxID=6943 RepID=A0AAQ4EX96_AMBAM